MKKSKDETNGKLVLSLNNKERYVLHIRNLKYYLEQGLKLTKVHRCVQFTQKAWLKDYIDFNTKKEQRPLMILKKICLN